MARPIVLVYQEFAAVTVTPDTPDLNCLVAGPAYWLQDYADDKADIKTATNYGTLNADNPYVPPLPSTDAITVADPPHNSTGALLDSSSVKVYFDEARVRIAEDSDDGDASTGASVAANANTVTATGGTPINFLTTGVAVGDYIIIEDPAGGGTDLVKRVLAVDSATILRTTTNFATSGTTLLFRIEREVSDVLIDNSFLDIDGNQIIIQGGVTTVLTGEVTARTVTFAKAYIQYRSLRQDLASVDTVTSETEITTKLGRIDARNPLAGVAKTALANTTTQIQFFGVRSDNSTGHNECMEITEGRTDVYAVVPITVDRNIIASYKVEVEGLASVSVAETTGVPQKFRVVLGAQELPTQSVVSGAYTGGNHQSVDGAISGTPIVAADDINVFADADATFVTAGIRAGDTLVIVSDAAGTSRIGSYAIEAVYDEQRIRVETSFPGTNKMAGAVRYYIIRGTGTPETLLPATWTAGSCAAPNTLTTALDRAAGVANEYLGKVARIAAGNTNAGDFLITASTAADPAVFTVYPVVVTEVALTGDQAVVNPLMAVTTARDVVTRRCFRVIRDNSATFVTDLVKATDLLQVPNPISGTSYTATFDHTVAYIPNENVVVMTADTDVIATNPEIGDTSLKFRIARDLTKDDQVDELVAISQSFNSRRVVLVWPDSMDVADLVDGSKTRSDGSTPEAADPQPGYYMAGVVGGMTAGLPSHQGFTNLGCAGIDQLYHSTRYFSDSQLTELSDGGWFVWGQATPNTLPYCIHQLTTDPDTLESGEFSVVKNFDFVSLFFQDILNDFLGEYNIYDETLGLLEEAMDSGIELLKLRRYAKIGAPILSMTVNSVAVSPAAADRVEIYADVSLPKPLNRIGLHLVAV